MCAPTPSPDPLSQHPPCDLAMVTDQLIKRVVGLALGGSPFLRREPQSHCAVGEGHENTHHGLSSRTHAQDREPLRASSALRQLPCQPVIKLCPVLFKPPGMEMSRSEAGESAGKSPGPGAKPAASHGPRPGHFSSLVLGFPVCKVTGSSSHCQL